MLGDCLGGVNNLRCNWLTCFLNWGIYMVGQNPHPRGMVRGTLNIRIQPRGMAAYGFSKKSELQTVFQASALTRALALTQTLALNQALALTQALDLTEALAPAKASALYEALGLTQALVLTAAISITKA